VFFPFNPDGAKKNIAVSTVKNPNEEESKKAGGISDGI